MDKIRINNKKCIKYENDAYIVWLSGKIFLLDSNGNIKTEQPLEIIHAAFKNILCYDDLYGFYKILGYNKAENRYIFWGDNAGSQLFYIYRNQVSDTLLALVDDAFSFHIDMEATAQLFELGGVLFEKTLIQEIKKTSPDYWYEISADKVCIHHKNLSSLSNIHKKMELYDSICLLCQNEENIWSVCTGGTDSRSVISALIKNKIMPKLIITGHEGNPDIAIAKKISSLLGTELIEIDPGEKEKNWLNVAFEFMDGMYDPVLGYRQLQKIKAVCDGGGRILFGGVGGEYYKNNYCKPFLYHLLVRKASVSEVVQRIFPIHSKIWYGGKIREKAAASVRQLFVSQKIELERENTNLTRFNRAGQFLLQSKFSVITNAISAEVLQVDPLTEPRIIRAIGNKSPVCLSMSRWQRKEIKKNCACLGEILTDQGYTCSLNLGLYSVDVLKKALFWSSRIVARVQKKLGKIYKDISPQYWTSDYVEARKCPEWNKAVDFCKQKELIAVNATESDIPLANTGEILLIGMLAERFHIT